MRNFDKGFMNSAGIRSMESEGERRPLLATKKTTSCFRIPSQITITTIILGLFLVVVTAIILFENLQTTKKKTLEIGEKLLGSAFNVETLKREDTYDDGGKIVPDPAGGRCPFHDEDFPEYDDHAPTRCPYQHRLLTLSDVVPKAEPNCALMAQQVRKKFGKCVDMSFLPKECKPSWRVKCFSSYKYRKIDGTCNNRIHPTWGKSGTPYLRMLAPDYADGTSTIRSASDGGPLPNARYLSNRVYSRRLMPLSDVSVLFLYFGLLVDHDMVSTAGNSGPIPCCDEDFQKYPESRPTECLEIHVPKDDVFYVSRDVSCLNLLRSLPVNGECAGRREQLNQATAFLDGSAVYGSTIEHTKQLRSFSRGQLNTEFINDTPFMAFAEGKRINCGTPSEPHKCFEAGDSRANMLVELSSMHTLWYREHNRIATELHKLHSKWTDEILFQEARRILIGELQHITFNEFLPILLGEKGMSDYDLQLSPSDTYDGYDDTIDPGIFNVFAAAAFRFGHSIVPDMQLLVAADNSTHKIPLHNTFFNNAILFHDGFDALLRGAALQKTQSVDSYITPELRGHLFQPTRADYGHDLAAVGIQRGRDHGLPGYVKWRSVCGLSEIKTWDDLNGVMDTERAHTLKQVYRSVEDIDLIPGALSEHHVNGSLLGPTYHCLIGRQFKKTRKGDRFWFENRNQPGSFTKAEMDEIYKSSMARILCDNSNDFGRVQKLPFLIPSLKNPVVDCDNIPRIDLKVWSSSDNA